MATPSDPDPTLGGPRPIGRLGPYIASIWLFFLADPIMAGWRERDTWHGRVGMLATVVFAGTYMAVWLRTRRDRAMFIEQPPLAWSAIYLAGMTISATAVLVSLGEVGLTCVVYFGPAVVMLFVWQVALATVVGLIVFTLGLGAAAGWGSQAGTAFGMAAASVAVFGLRSAMQRNVDLIRAHQENSALAVENERTRFARDLHDILGHSLTVITVKAELAGRLLDQPDGVQRVRAEIADLERLSRDALADVRRAVEGYREISLPGEIARARTALAAAQIEARLPNSTDEVPTELRDLFAWTVREGVTNVLRHSRATSCTITISPQRIEVRDDGLGHHGATGSGGSGLAGLRERAAAVSASVAATATDPGFRLEVVVG